eukprot:COSAG04_NODE_2098_length_4786_cov_436.917004_4_plen_58_part_00
MPSNVGIYTKLVGNTHAGVFQALLQLLMGVAQTVGGQLTGIACKRLARRAAFGASSC